MVKFYQSTRCHILEDIDFYIYRFDDHKSHMWEIVEILVKFPSESLRSPRNIHT